MTGGDVIMRVTFVESKDLSRWKKILRFAQNDRGTQNDKWVRLKILLKVSFGEL